MESNENQAIEKVKAESMSVLDRAKLLVVIDQKTYDAAVELYKVALAVEKAADAAHDPVVSHWYDMHKAACEAKKADKALATEAKLLAKKKAADWQDEQERLRKEEEDRLRKIAEEEARKAKEAAEAEEKRQRKQEEAERLELAAQAEQSGAEPEEVSAILETPLYNPEPVQESFIPVAPTAAPTYQKAQGFTVRWNYSAQCNDVMALIRAAAANPSAFAMYLQPNQTALNQIARVQKESFSVPGCQLRKERV